jgi:hypothetical protein
LGVVRDPEVDVLAAVLDAFSGPREVTVAQARGSTGQLLSDTELKANVYALAARRLLAAAIAQLLDRLWQLHDMATIHPLMILASVSE